VTFKLEKDAFAFYDGKTVEWIVEPGDFNIMIGSSSEDIRISTLLKL
jgi:beta-glucosidase